MTVVLREWETFAGSNTPVVGATVSARAASNTNPNVGAVVASTTTNASGMWEFTSLADAVYDVDIVYNGRTRWRKGNSKSSYVLDAYNLPGTVWSNWTPAGITQSGGLNTSASRTRYRIIDKIVTVVFSFTFSSAGTTANVITLTLPAALTAAAANLIVGAFGFQDQSVSWYVGSLFMPSTTTVVGIVHQGSAIPGGVGLNPNFAVASGDIWMGEMRYEGA